MTALLTITQLKKSFGTRVLLDVNALTLNAGKIYALTGDNGSGKSTFLRIIAGLEPAEVLRGDFCGIAMDDVNYAPALRREIIYVHQHPYLFNTSIEANIEYGLKMRGVEKNPRRQCAIDAINWAGLNHVAEVALGEKRFGKAVKVRDLLVVF